jgi:phosphatidylglycerol lysyltransferase
MIIFKLSNSLKRKIVNLAIVLIIMSGIGNIIFSLPHKFKALDFIGQHYAFFRPETMLLHRTVSTAVGFILIFLSYRLYKRMRMAWIIIISVLPVSVLLHILTFHDYINAFTLSEVFVILVLATSHKDFNRVSNPINLKWGFIIASISLFMVLLNTALGLLIMETHYTHIDDFMDSVIRSFQLFFYMDVSVIEPKTRAARLFGQSAIALNWISLISALFLILKPLVYQPIVSLRDREKVRTYLSLYGDNPTSYVAIEEDKKYYFGSNVEGAIVYVAAAGVAVCVGDPVCRQEDAVILLSEFISFCRQNELDICFCQTTENMLSIYKDMRFGITKYGEEAMFELESYNISGSKAAKVRQAINNANRLGIEVFEYKPREKRNKQLEEQIMEVSQEWLAFKKSGELSFLLGSIALDNPMDRRYFVAADSQNIVQGFIVFVPFAGGEGYYSDVTRRRKEAPIGVMEKIVICAFRAMKNEGVKWGSLGLAPLANVREGEQCKPITSLVLELIYEHLNNFYGFKTLHQYKRKYGPTAWEPRYLAYYPGVFTPKIAYSIIKVQNPKGVKDYILQQIKLLYQNRKV